MRHTSRRDRSGTRPAWRVCTRGSLGALRPRLSPGLPLSRTSIEAAGDVGVGPHILACSTRKDWLRNNGCRAPLHDVARHAGGVTQVTLGGAGRWSLHKKCDADQRERAPAHSGRCDVTTHEARRARLESAQQALGPSRKNPSLPYSLGHLASGQPLAPVSLNAALRSAGQVSNRRCRESAHVTGLSSADYGMMTPAILLLRVAWSAPNPRGTAASEETKVVPAGYVPRAAPIK